MRRMPRGLTPCVLVLGAALLSCDGPNRGANTQPSAASGFTVAVTASPNVVRGAGLDPGGCSTVQVIVQKNGALVDGALVTVTTTLGFFVSPQQDLTNRGVATFQWCAGITRGTSTITATAEEATATVMITIF
jgi:hypothetical protein